MPPRAYAQGLWKSRLVAGILLRKARKVPVEWKCALPLTCPRPTPPPEVRGSGGGSGRLRLDGALCGKAAHMALGACYPVPVAPHVGGAGLVPYFTGQGAIKPTEGVLRRSGRDRRTSLPIALPSVPKRLRASFVLLDH